MVNTAAFVGSVYGLAASGVNLIADTLSGSDSSYQNPMHYHEGLDHQRPGKIEIVPTRSLATQADLAKAYSPGVAEPVLAIAENPDLTYELTRIGNQVAVVSDGTAILGVNGSIEEINARLGRHRDFGKAQAFKPVGEGKANLFKKFADVDAISIELNTGDLSIYGPENEMQYRIARIVRAVKAIAPTFGGINLEDIKAPECFEILKQLQECLDIPVFHDDQHGTAIVFVAAFLNACKITNRELKETKVVFSGAGASAIACAELLIAFGLPRENIFMCDSKGLVYNGRSDMRTMDRSKLALAHDLGTLRGLGLVGEGAFDGKITLENTIKQVRPAGFVGLSSNKAFATPQGKSVITHMPKNAIIFPMANPDPELTLAEVRRYLPDAIYGSGRSDFPNQVNNVLCFPFLFRGALDAQAKKVSDNMQRAAVLALAGLATEEVPASVLNAYAVDAMEFGAEYVLPKPFDPRLLVEIAYAVAEAAINEGNTRLKFANNEEKTQWLARYRTQLDALSLKLQMQSDPKLAFKLAAKRLLREAGISERIAQAGAKATRSIWNQAMAFARK